VAHSSVAARRTDREVSQIHSKGIRTPFGKRAQSHAAILATPAPAMRFPAKKSGRQVAAENRMLRKTAA
jgi:hypothetical protein